MQNKITKAELLKIVEDSELDETIKKIFLRDIELEHVNEFYIDQVISYCGKAMEVLKKQIPADKQI